MGVEWESIRAESSLLIDVRERQTTTTSEPWRAFGISSV
jgi:hypothetical protein